MPHYDYICINLQGEYLRGELEVTDRRELISRLWEFKLFLIWWKEKAGASADPGLVPMPAGEGLAMKRIVPEEVWELFNIWLPGSQQRTTDEAGKSPRTLPPWLTRWPFLIGLSLFLAYTVYFNVHYWGQRRPHGLAHSAAEISQEGQKKLAGVLRGMRRDQIEKIFERRANPPGTSALTRYFLEGEDILVEIVFDNEGGSWKPQNRVVKRGTIFIKGEAIVS